MAALSPAVAATSTSAPAETATHTITTRIRVMTSLLSRGRVLVPTVVRVEYLNSLLTTSSQEEGSRVRGL